MYSQYKNEILFIYPVQLLEPSSLHLVLHRDVVLLHISQVLFNMLALDIEGSDIQQDKDHTTGLLLIQVLPQMHAASVDT